MAKLIQSPNACPVRNIETSEELLVMKNITWKLQASFGRICKAPDMQL